MPWVLLCARIWYGQVYFVHQIMAMSMAHQAALSVGPALYVPSSLQAVFHGVAPLLITTGFLTRPVSLVVMVFEIMAGMHGTFSAPEVGRLGLLVWLAVYGAGPLSLDALLARGLSLAPLGIMGYLLRAYEWVDQYIAAHFVVVVRLAIATAFVSSAILWLPGAGGMVPFGSPEYTALRYMIFIAGWLVAAGLLTRISLVAGMVAVAGVNTLASMDDRFSVLLPLILVAVSGPGPKSIDALLVKLAKMHARQPEGLSAEIPHVVVVGGGFGGIAVVAGLRKSPCRITLIDQNNHHLFQPLLYQVATAALSAGQIAIPIRSLFRNQFNVQVRLGKVTGVDASTREVEIGATKVKYDYLVLATGAQHSYFGQDDWASFAPGLKSLDDAVSIRSQILRAFEEAENSDDDAQRRAWLTFVIVGGGPTGIELAGAIAELARHGLEQEYRNIDPSKARVVLLQAGSRLLPTFPPRLSEATLRSLQDLGVEVRLDTRVTGIDETGVDLGDRHIAARTTVWAAGVAASAAAEWLGQQTDRSGRLTVAQDLSVPAFQNIYAIGDTALSLGWDGNPVPGLAPAARQQGKYVARVIGAQLAGHRPPPVFQYRHWGSLATIGRQAAVAHLGGVCVRGAIAWWFWGAAHIFFLVGGRNRLAVIFDWIWSYLTYRHGSRLIGKRSGSIPS